jgi:hypothetical protein
MSDQVDGAGRWPDGSNGPWRGKLRRGDAARNAGEGHAHPSSAMTKPR